MRGSGTGRVFISYRRQEAAWPARQLYDLLSDEFGADQVFKDVDDIDPGDDFADKIIRAVGSCDVLLALVGEQWLTITDEQGRRRLDDPDDFVRLEIATALDRRDVRVIPILLDDARMPRARELPAELESLVRRQAVQLNALSFDATRLMAAVKQTLADLHAESQEPAPVAVPVGDPASPERSGRPDPDRGGDPPGLPGGRAVLLSALAVLAVLAAVLLAVRLGGGADPSPAGAGSPLASSSGASGTPQASPDGPDVLAHRGGWEQYPLESLPALTSAARDGFAVETDVRWTSDDVPVVVHDEAATKGLACSRPVLVSETTWQDLSTMCQSTPSPKDQKQYPISTYPDAMEALAAVPGSWVYVEVKVDQTPEQQRRFLQVIRDNGMSDRTVVTAFHLRYLQAIHRAAPGLRLMLFTQAAVPVRELAGEDLWAVATYSQITTKRYVRDLHDAGVIVVEWPLNDPAAWAAGRAVGADKVLTDNPSAYAAWRTRT